VGVVVATLLGIGCGGSNAGAPSLGKGIHAGGEATRPLIVEWASSDRAELEAIVHRGLVAVRYDGRNMELLPACTIAGRYGYTPITLKVDRITIRDANELYAQVPLGAAKVEGALTTSGQLNVDMTVIGRFEAAYMGDAQGDCSRATHIVTALTVGAFDFYSGTSSSSGAEASARGPGLGIVGRSSRDSLSRDGDVAACAKAAATDSAPPFGCGAIMRVDLVPVTSSSVTSTTAGAAPDGPAPPVLPGAPPARAAGPVASGTMARIPGGRVRLGATDLSGNALPVQELVMQPFDLDVTEVTDGAYGLCVDAGRCEPATHMNQADRRENPQLPVIVTRAEAQAYCSWARKRLPTEEEWEYAARGADFRKYPWGQEDLPASEYCRIETPFHEFKMCPVGATPRDRSPFGVLDMAGSAQEWVQSAVGPDAYGLRGGKWQGPAATRLPEDSRTARRQDSYGGGVSGFRCARSLSDTPASPRARLR